MGKYFSRSKTVKKWRPASDQTTKGLSPTGFAHHFLLVVGHSLWILKTDGGHLLKGNQKSWNKKQKYFPCFVPVRKPLRLWGCVRKQNWSEDYFSWENERIRNCDHQFILSSPVYKKLCQLHSYLSYLKLMIRDIQGCYIRPHPNLVQIPKKTSRKQHQTVNKMRQFAVDNTEYREKKPATFS